MAGSRPPHLVPVPEPTPEAAGETALEGSTPSRPRAPWIVAGVLGLALVVCAVLLGRQASTTRALEARVEALSTALAGAEAEIGARRLHLDAVRDEVQRVQTGLETLAELVGREPAPAPPARPEPATPEPAPAAD